MGFNAFLGLHEGLVLLKDLSKPSMPNRTYMSKNHLKRGFNQCCIIRSVPAGTDGKSRTGMLTGTSHPYVPPRPKSRPVPACFGRFGLFRPVSAGNPVSAGLLFKPLPTVSVTSSRLQQSSPVHLRLFFFFFLLPSSSFFFLLLLSSSFFFFLPPNSLSVSDSLYLFFTFFFCFLVQVP